VIGGRTNEQPIASVLKEEHVDSQGFGIYEPIFLYAVLFVEVALLNAVSLAVSQGDNFDGEIDGSMNCISDDPQTVLRDENHVRLHDAVRGKDHLNRSGYHVTKLPLGHPLVKPTIVTERDFLMIKRRRGGHNKFSVPKLAGLVAFREFGHEFVVGVEALGGSYDRPFQSVGAVSHEDNLGFALWFDNSKLTAKVEAKFDSRRRTRTRRTRISSQQSGLSIVLRQPTPSIIGRRDLAALTSNRRLAPERPWGRRGRGWQ
jgi:hypothetical protein